MMKFLQVVLVFLMFSCNLENNQESDEKSASIAKFDDSLSYDNAIQEAKGIKQANNDNVLGVFQVENSELKQEVKLSLKAKDSLYFELSSINKLSNNVSELSGIAILKQGTEIDEDENGVSYMAKEFIYQNNCWLAIRIDLNGNDKVKIKAVGCDEFRKNDNPFTSIGLMRPLK